MMAMIIKAIGMPIPIAIAIELSWEPPDDYYVLGSLLSGDT